jgi:hypothetical protein
MHVAHISKYINTSLSLFAVSDKWVVCHVICTVCPTHMIISIYYAFWFHYQLALDDSGVCH